MIYFVDEDMNELEPFAIELMNRGYEVSMIGDADEAFSALIDAKAIDAVILDVMLATKENGVSQYNAVDTNNFITTGLSLLDDLVEQFKEKNRHGDPESCNLFCSSKRLGG